MTTRKVWGRITHLGPSEFLHLLHGGEVVDGSVLDDGQEDEEEAGPQVDIHSLDIGHLGHRC